MHPQVVGVGGSVGFRPLRPLDNKGAEIPEPQWRAQVEAALTRVNAALRYPQIRDALPSHTLLEFLLAAALESGTD